MQYFSILDSGILLYIVRSSIVIKNFLLDFTRWLTFQACAYRGHDESRESMNQGNFLELVKLLASYNKEVHAVVLDNAPRNARYTSHTVQQEILKL
jgi:hypothetical protein